ncbi:Muscle calcium channel subunit alpha-1 [Symbiodinium microadriaticum]|uniref:Muscle calcium channel subunit alpha-1 n=1 Tax=Symbiodinium microadriaticum TaxID=2951 RepID=A0A1Q9F7Q2_SYMMI|nr:Muscle calcium channel subunit alpha-1 [Symbiodinium microadriaticum]
MAEDLNLWEVLRQVQKQQEASSKSIEILREQHQQSQGAVLQLLERVEKADVPEKEWSYSLPVIQYRLEQADGDLSPQVLVDEADDILDPPNADAKAGQEASRTSKSSPDRKSATKNTMKNLQLSKNGALKKVVAEMMLDTGSKENLELASWWKRLNMMMLGIEAEVSLLNMMMLGIEAEVSLINENEEVVWATWVERIFLAIYTVECALRVFAKGSDAFRNMWFLLDFFLVIVGLLALVVFPLVGTAAGGIEKILVVRGLRLLRLARALRMVGRLKVIWRLVYGLITAGQTMFSTTLLIGLVLFICGCVAVEIITKNKDFCRDPTSETCQVVHKHFADLGTSILTLVQFVTLDSIAEVYFPIIVQQPLLLVFFLPILMFVSITLMDLITAVLVENALEFAAHEAEAERIKTKQRALWPACTIFNEIDEDASGCVTHDEIEKVSVDVLPPRLLETVSVDSMTDLFELLDVDGSGRLTRGEFVEGLLNLVLMDVPIWTIQSLKLLRLIRGQTLKLDEELASLKASLSKDEGAI